jgi:predicted 2-oxoglutarate/Fe(II)-dependent dioxygenase YbiX
MRELTDQLDARALEVARLRARAERAEGALGRVLALCDGVEARGALLAPHQVRQAIAP